VPLSEHEERILQDIEKRLYQEDPSFAREVERRRARFSQASRVKVGIAVFVAGFAMLIAFFLSGSVFLGILAFGAMVGGIVLVAGAFRGFAMGAGRSQERLSQAWRRLEERLRQRYKGD